MSTNITMSSKEINRISIMEQLLNKQMKQRKAAKILGLSARQIRRLKKRYQKEGATGMVHQNRGKKSNNKISAMEMDRISKIIKDHYGDFGPTLAHEKLQENHGVTFSRETLRRIMIQAEIWKPKKQKRLQVHQMRQRRSQRGELVQIDGSPHAWFENRAPKCCLLVFIDDASSELLWLEFCKSETTNAYFKACFGYFKKDGKPLAFYSDKHSIFRINSRKDGLAGIEDNHNLTQFGSALKKLDIELIHANTPQAKGRVEKANRTLQDRLVKELRLKGISNIKQANEYLPEFIRHFNQKFAVIPTSPEDAHRPLLQIENLEEILVKKYTRTLSKNLEVQYGNKIYQIQIDKPAYCMRNAKVSIIEDRFNKIKIYYQGKHLKPKQLEYKILTKNPKTETLNTKLLNVKIDSLKRKQQILNKTVPPQDHPWRQYQHKYIHEN